MAGSISSLAATSRTLTAAAIAAAVFRAATAEVSKGAAVAEADQPSVVVVVGVVVGQPSGVAAAGVAEAVGGAKKPGQVR